MDYFTSRIRENLYKYADRAFKIGSEVRHNHKKNRKCRIFNNLVWLSDGPGVKVHKSADADMNADIAILSFADAYAYTTIEYDICADADANTDISRY